MIDITSDTVTGFHGIKNTIGLKSFFMKDSPLLKHFKMNTGIFFWITYLFCSSSMRG